MYNSNSVVGFGGSAISAIDIALWDIYGKYTGQPIHKLLGGKVRDSVPVYATGLYYTENEFTKKQLKEASDYVDQGFLGMKTKVGGLPIQKDVDRVKAIRNEIGNNYSVEGELRSQVGRNIKRLIDIGTYKGARHKNGLPVNGQNTKNNARTRKGKKRTVANKRKAV